MAREDYHRIARIMLDDGAIWFVYDAWVQYHGADNIAEQTWTLLRTGKGLTASQSRQAHEMKDDTLSVVVFNPDKVRWVTEDQG